MYVSIYKKTAHLHNDTNYLSKIDERKLVICFKQTK